MDLTDTQWDLVAPLIPRPRRRRDGRGRPRRDPREVLDGVLWHLRRGQKGGSAVGKTQGGKGIQILAIADRQGLPIAAGIASASPHEVTLVEDTIDNGFLEHAPDRLVGDRAYDSDALDARLREERGIERIAPHRGASLLR